jgi:hypothetical protein
VGQAGRVLRIIREGTGRSTCQGVGRRRPYPLSLSVSLPRAQTTRGFHPDLVVIDEVAYTSPELMMKTILPVLSEKKIALIGISTPEGEDNMMTELITKVDKNSPTGKLLFNVVRMGFVCDACRTAGLEMSCNHHSDRTPPWKSTAKVRFSPRGRHNPHVLPFFFTGRKPYACFPLFRREQSRLTLLSVMFCYGKKNRCASRAEQLSPTLDGQSSIS